VTPTAPAAVSRPAVAGETALPETRGVSTLDSEFDRAAQAVLETPRDAVVLLVCHVNPDGDALGSMLGFGLGLRQLGFTQVIATFPEPFAVAPVFGFIPGQEMLVPPAQAPVAPDLAFSFDAAAVGRLGELAPALQQAPTWVVLDHHVSNPGFGVIRLIDPDAAATSVVAARLLDRLGVTFDREIATGLYVALVTDTGSFKFDMTTADVHLLAARLVAAGASPSQVALNVFDSRPFAAIRLLTEVMARAELFPSAASGAGMITTYATLDDLDRHGQAPQVLESFMDVLRTAQEADVACLVKPVAEGRWAVSLRSRGGTDVSAVAVALGGGGHRLAAGFTGFGTAADVVAAVRKALD
jgi:phosphoesterase RecJ-like protein